MSTTGSTAQDPAWKAKEQGDETRYAAEQEREQLAALAAEIKGRDHGPVMPAKTEEIEGGYGGQEELEDRYATTSGEH